MRAAYLLRVHSDPGFRMFFPFQGREQTILLLGAECACERHALVFQMPVHSSSGYSHHRGANKEILSLIRTTAAAIFLRMRQSDFLNINFLKLFEIVEFIK